MSKKIVKIAKGYYPTVSYNHSPSELVRILSSKPEENWLTAISETTRPDLSERGMAAIGLILCGIHTCTDFRDQRPDLFMDYMQWAHNIAQTVRGGGYDHNTLDLSEINKTLPFLDKLAGVNLDGTTCEGILNNRPHKTASLIEREIASDGRLMIALGNGGITSGVDNFAAMRKADDVIHSVWYSHRKADHKEPILGDAEKEWLIAAAKDRAVIINEDDIYNGTTIYKAAKYFKKLLGCKAIYGVATNTEAVKSKGGFGPEIVKLGGNNVVYYSRFSLMQYDDNLWRTSAGKIVCGSDYIFAEHKRNNS